MIINRLFKCKSCINHEYSLDKLKRQIEQLESKIKHNTCKKCGCQIIILEDVYIHIGNDCPIKEDGILLYKDDSIITLEIIDKNLQKIIKNNTN